MATFAKIVETGSLSKAARARRLSLAAVSSSRHSAFGASSSGAEITAWALYRVERRGAPAVRALVDALIGDRPRRGKAT